MRARRSAPSSKLTFRTSAAPISTVGTAIIATEPKAHARVRSIAEWRDNPGAHGRIRNPTATLRKPQSRDSRSSFGEEFGFEIVAKKRTRKVVPLEHLPSLRPSTRATQSSTPRASPLRMTVDPSAPWHRVYLRLHCAKRELHMGPAKLKEQDLHRDCASRGIGRGARKSMAAEAS